MEEQWAQLEARGPDGRSPASPYGLVRRDASRPEADTSSWGGHGVMAGGAGSG